jgi:hypothetical protein
MHLLHHLLGFRSSGSFEKRLSFLFGWHVTTRTQLCSCCTIVMWPLLVFVSGVTLKMSHFFIVSKIGQPPKISSKLLVSPPQISLLHCIRPTDSRLVIFDNLQRFCCKYLMGLVQSQLFVSNTTIPGHSLAMEAHNLSSTFICCFQRPS